jgi:hypothetical protein
MTDEKTQLNPNDRPEDAKPGESGQEAQQQESTPAEPGQRVPPGRRPLFGN